MERLERLLLEVYRAARDLSLDAFQAWVLDRLQGEFNVESSVWGSGRFEGTRFVPSRMKLMQTSPEAAKECMQIDAKDKVIPVVMSRL